MDPFITAWVDNGNGRVPNPELTEAQFQAMLDAQQKANIAALWQAAHDYEYAEISGSAIGLLTLGVLQQKPKCTAVQAWIQSIWSLYYQRKAAMTHDIAPSDLDFSSCGPCPWTVPDLLAELGM